MIAAVATQPYAATGKDLNNAAAESSPTLLDVELHSKIGANAPYVADGPATWTHEGVHGVDNDIQLSNACYGAQFFCAFYLGNSIYAKVPLAAVVTRADCVEHIPQRARIGRFDFYFNVVDSHEAHRTPSYILEEWNAYIFGASAGFEVNEAGKWTSTALENLFQGPSEFAIFYSGCIAAFAAKEPTYLSAANVKEFLAHQFERSFSLYHKTRKYAARFPGEEDTQFAAFVNDADGAAARTAVKALFGDAFWGRVVLNNGAVNPTNLTPASTVATTTARGGTTGTVPIVTNPDEAWNQSLFDASKLSWNALQLSKERGPEGGGGGKLLGNIPKPTLAPVMWSSDDCFFAVARNNGVQLSNLSCDRPSGNELSVGEPVIVDGTGRIWEDQCGTWGWLAEVKYKGQNYWVREDTLLIFTADPARCDAKVIGVVPEQLPTTTRFESTSMSVSVSGPNDATTISGVTSGACAQSTSAFVVWALMLMMMMMMMMK
jgi:hypothetical protein